jgi:hypothetical protein
MPERSDSRFRHRLLQSIPSFLAVACLLACANEAVGPASSPNGASPNAAEAPADPAKAGIIDRRGKGGASVFVAHQVSDFDGFRKFFEEGAGEREKAGVKGHLLTRLDDGQAVAHLFADDLEVVKMTFDSPKLKEYFDRSGHPDATFYWLAYDELVKVWEKPPAVPTFSLYVKLSAADLPALRDGFVKLQPVFAEQSVIASGLHHSIAQADLFFLHFVGTDHEQLGALTKRAEFEEWLKKSGTAGAPQSFLGADLSRSRTYYDDFK